MLLPSVIPPQPHALSPAACPPPQPHPRLDAACALQAWFLCCAVRNNIPPPGNSPPSRCSPAMASARAPAVRSDIVSSLPLELATSVLLRVDLEDLLACSAVCRSWRSLARLECLYVPYLQRKHARPASGRSATALAPAASVRSQLLERYRGLSASSYFSSCETLRDLALRHLRLQKQWATGVPTRKFGLLAEGGQDARLLSVVVDPLWDLVITGGVDGTVRFWCTKTRRPVDTAHARGLVELARPGIAAMALEGDYLVVGDNVRAPLLRWSHLTAPSPPLPFRQVSSTSSSATTRHAPLSAPPASP